MNQLAIISKIRKLRAMAQMMDQEATSLEKLLADVSTSAVRKGLGKKQTESLVISRRLRLKNKKSRQL